VIEEGEIVETGKHDDMIGEDGVYASALFDAIAIWLCLK